MRCQRCGYRLVPISELYGEPSDGGYWAVDPDGGLVALGTWCVPDRHVVTYDQDDIDSAVRQIANAVGE